MSGDQSVQFYLDGYRPGDPFVEQPHPSVAERPDGLPEEVDVLIVGCGPAGLVLAAQLANFPDITTAVVDRRDGPLEVGPGRRRRLPHRGDVRGVRARRPAGRRGATGSTRSSFWRPDPEDRDADHAHRAHPGRRGRPVGVPARDRQPGADARLPAASHMERSASRLRPFYGLHAGGLDGRPTARRSTRSTVTLQHMEDRQETGGPRRSAPSTSSAATARAAASGRRSAASWSATRRTSPGA